MVPLAAQSDLVDKLRMAEHISADGVKASIDYLGFFCLAVGRGIDLYHARREAGCKGFALLGGNRLKDLDLGQQPVGSRR